MTVRIGINGFGRIGRQVLRIAEERGDVEVVGINNRSEPKVMAPCSDMTLLMIVSRGQWKQVKTI